MSCGVRHISASLPHVEERKQLRAVWMLLLATVCWGMSFPLMKGLVLLQERLLPDASVWFITAQTSTVRFGVAAIVLALICGRRMRGFTQLDLKLGVGLGVFAGTGTLLQMAALFTGDILWLDDREFASADKVRATVAMFASMAVISLPVAIWQAPANSGWWRVYLSPGMSVILLVLLGASTLV